MYQYRFRFLFIMSLRYILPGLAILTLGRLALLWFVNTDIELDTRVQDLLRALWVGFRFDAKVVAIGFSPLILAGLLSLTSARLFQKITNISSWYATVIYALMILASAINVYYFLAYGNHLDVFLFGLFDDDSQAIMDTLWQSYPLFSGVMATIIIAFFLGHTFCIKYKSYNSNERYQSQSIRTHIMYCMAIAAFVVAYFIVARGSIGSLPLKRYHASVSELPLLNATVPNAFMALDWAHSDYQKQEILSSIEEKELREQMFAVLGKPTPFEKTLNNDYLKNNPPHVVITLMEGMGMNMLVEDDKETNDLLGRLRPYFHKEFVFTRFLAGTSATIDSIVMMLFHSDVPTISHSTYSAKSLSDSAVEPYNRAGYQTIFIYGGNAMWRNLSRYLPLQGFDHVYDENTIIDTFPEAKKSAGTWGVADEYTFKLAQEILEKASKPTFIYIMTVTNHSPFYVPDNYQAKPVAASPRLKSRVHGETVEVSTMLKAYQYASDALGGFIEAIDDSALSERTIIAATGDHHLRFLSKGAQNEIALNHAVPFFLKVPKPILTQTPYYYDPTRIGSHRDIFPTLYHFSLSNSPYSSLGGENLLQKQPVSNYGYNNSVVINSQGVYRLSSPKKLYPWRSLLTNEREAVTNSEPNWGRNYQKLQHNFLRFRVNANSEKHALIRPTTTNR
ncbi:LTA synthase family protein [Salinivibrio sp. DV]|uniref:LTA synthase family protein n=1 Tax=Salinivibrio sp. SS2 TaxID=1892894 RepID=UPI000A073EFF|nr:alkaline phosphatase family protein [Salinivibrio sp. DV]